MRRISPNLSPYGISATASCLQDGAQLHEVGHGQPLTRRVIVAAGSSDQRGRSPCRLHQRVVGARIHAGDVRRLAQHVGHRRLHHLEQVYESR